MRQYIVCKNGNCIGTAEVLETGNYAKCTSCGELSTVDRPKMTVRIFISDMIKTLRARPEPVDLMVTVIWLLLLPATSILYLFSFVGKALGPDLEELR